MVHIGGISPLFGEHAVVMSKYAHFVWNKYEWHTHFYTFTNTDSLRDTIRKLHTNTVGSLGGYSRSHKIRNTSECREFRINTFHYKFTILLWRMIPKELDREF